MQLREPDQATDNDEWAQKLQRIAELNRELWEARDKIQSLKIALFAILLAMIAGFRS